MRLWRYRSKLRIVTGADSSHARSLVNLLGSLQRHEPRSSVTIYDLGLTGDDRRAAQDAYPLAVMKTFDYSSYPPHLNIRVDAGKYAWKPVIVWTELQLDQTPLCWMDAGNKLRRSLICFRRELRRDGFLSYQSPDTIRDWTHPAMLRRLGLPETWDQDRRNLNAACVAFNPRRPAVRQLAADWAEHALDPDCIAPRGSDRTNHRQDQALLTVLAYASGVIDAPTRSVKRFGRRNLRREVLYHQDVERRGV